MIDEKDLPLLKERYKKIIQDELALAGFTEEDGDFIFRYECKTFILYFHESDPSFVRLMLPGIYWLRDADQEQIRRAEECANEVNHRCKAIKLFRSLKTDKDGEYSVAASIEFFVEDIPSLSSRLFERYLSAIKSGAMEFRSAFNTDDSIGDRTVKPILPSSPLRH